MTGQLLVLAVLAVATAAHGGVSDAVVKIHTPGLGITFNKSNAMPVSVTNAHGEELLDPNVPQPGFYLLQPGNRTAIAFDTVEVVGTNELLFSVAATGQQIGWAFGGAGRYFTANCTQARGFKVAAAAATASNFAVRFELVASGLHGIGLNFMIYDFTAEGVEQPH